MFREWRHIMTRDITCSPFFTFNHESQLRFVITITGTISGHIIWIHRSIGPPLDHWSCWWDTMPYSHLNTHIATTCTHVFTLVLDHWLCWWHTMPYKHRNIHIATTCAPAYTLVLDHWSCWWHTMPYRHLNTSPVVWVPRESFSILTTMMLSVVKNRENFAVIRGDVWLEMISMTHLILCLHKIPNVRV